MLLFLIVFFEKQGHSTLDICYTNEVGEQSNHSVSGFASKQMSRVYVMPAVDLKPLEDIFRASVFKMLKDECKIDEDTISKLMSWRHSGFSVHNGPRAARDDEKGKEAISQYIIRNSFSLEKLTYREKTNTVIYQSKMTPGKNKGNLQIYTPGEFIAAITQHIPEKSFQMVRYYGLYSNKSRGVRKKQGIPKPGEPLEQIPDNLVPAGCKRGKIYEVGPLCCPKCGGEMKIPALCQIIKKKPLLIFNFPNLLFLIHFFTKADQRKA